MNKPSENHRIEENLHRQLRSFGLNPREWLLRSISNEKYLIQKREDKKFCLLGVIDTQSLPSAQWSQIDLVLL